MEAGIISKVFPTILSKAVELVLQFLDLVTWAKLSFHYLLDLIPSHSKCNFSSSGALFLIPPSECSFVKNTHSITDLKVIGTLTIYERILDTLEPLKETSSSFVPAKLRRITGIKVCEGADWVTIPVSIPVPI